jgi:transcriptional regulator with XRE-family HTH domain
MDPEVKRYITILRTCMRLLDINNRDIERKLGLSPSYLSRLYSGGIELKAEHLVRIPQAMGLEPAEFFRLVYPSVPAPETPAASLIRDMLKDMAAPNPAAVPPPSSSPLPSEEHLELMLTAMRKLLDERKDDRKGERKEGGGKK